MIYHFEDLYQGDIIINNVNNVPINLGPLENKLQRKLSYLTLFIFNPAIVESFG